MNHATPLSVVILAAGKGTRMKSGKAKVLHEVFYSPMVHHVIWSVLPLEPTRIAVIIGHQKEAVQQSLKSFDVEFVVQKEQLGTGHAVLTAERAIEQGSGTVMILCGDTPLLQSATLQEMYNAHHASGADLTLMTTTLDNPTNYGRILTANDGSLRGIVEQKDASKEELAICEINAGIYCVERDFLFSALKQVGTNNSQGEVYLTDIVSIAVEQGKSAQKYITPHSMDVLGVNSRLELSLAHSELQKRRNEELMFCGITMHNPETISVSSGVTLGKDCLLKSGVSIGGISMLGENCIVGNGSVIEDCNIGDNVEIGPYCVLKGLTIPENSVLPPHQTTF
ncbi:bifunctional N-acetylglucosamine-1-phosphate uridyltransferase/glucosamine-1-phosphate acetyltransferase [Desulfopila sp. IMCC35008]|uniref:bifunctional UDP-N-acetylglucosamine diphosphorylase/glucosamine-1-phosphate N-acetyltransferase GlmU n=1 Tax=Desulfopila sp. IMCC35008 TaxID=2653858 RepID=UPI0013D1B677|nr:NTP transferase domain-containing protein [Desulfopila sp. IMCC35008]